MRGEHRSQPSPGSRLLVLVVVDQMRADYLRRYEARLSSGFKRLSGDGAMFTQAYYPYASTETAQGHAVMLSGRSPRVTGIVGDTAALWPWRCPRSHGTKENG